MLMFSDDDDDDDDDDVDKQWRKETHILPQQCFDSWSFAFAGVF